MVIVRRAKNRADARLSVASTSAARYVTGAPVTRAA